MLSPVEFEIRQRKLNQAGAKETGRISVINPIHVARNLKAVKLSNVRIDIRNLDWNLLRTFFIIVEERNLTRAAAQLQISQPSVSAALQRLEKQLGCRLVIRANRRFELTRQGDLLYGECARIFSSVSRIGEKLEGSQRDITGTVRLLVVTDVHFQPLERALYELHVRHPSISVEIESVSSPQAIRSITRQLVPVAICLLSQPIIGLNCMFLEREEFGVFCGPPNPLFGQEAVTLATIQEQNLVSFSCYNEGGTLEPMLALGIGTGFGDKVRGSSAQLGEVLRMVRAGIGIGILPVASVRREAETGALWRLQPEGLTLGADLYMITNPTMPLELAEASFIEIFQEVVTADLPVPEPRAATH